MQCIAGAGAALAAACVLVSPAAAGMSGSTNTLATLKVPSGEVLFQQHCAQCHGPDGSGDGPRAASLASPPADLTNIGTRADGTFPADRVAEIIRFGGHITAHGSAPMPVWGQLFNDEGGRGKVGNAYSRKAVIELTRYIETIQKK